MMATRADDRKRRKGRRKPDIADPREAAEMAGLVYVSDDLPGISRRRSGRGFSYRDANGRRVSDPPTLSRVRKLAIPPAYTEVWICALANGHLQATGRDARGRKQYRHHDAFRAIRDTAKYAHMLDFAAALPAIRSRVAADMALRGLPRDKVLATIVHLLEVTMIRVGNADYARQNRSYGLTTLRTRHVDVNGTELRFVFRGKSGRRWRLALRDRRVARIIRTMQELPGQHLFQYIDEEGERRDVGSADVNAYLREISGRAITAKDFRTWAGTVLAAVALAQCEAAETLTAARRNIKSAIADVAERLGNTPTICRKCYVHPTLIESYLAGDLLLDLPDETAGGTDDEAGLRPEETLVLAFLRRRLAARTGKAS